MIFQNIWVEGVDWRHEQILTDVSGNNSTPLLPIHAQFDYDKGLSIQKYRYLGLNFLNLLFGDFFVRVDKIVFWGEEVEGGGQFDLKSSNF